SGVGRSGAARRSTSSCTASAGRWSPPSRRAPAAPELGRRLRGRSAGSPRPPRRAAASLRRPPVSGEWVVAALVFAFANFVLGLVGFGNGLVAMALLPFLMSPVTAIVVLTIYTIVFAVAILLPLRRDVLPGPVLEMLAGTLIGIPGGVWILSHV